LAGHKGFGWQVVRQKESEIASNKNREGKLRLKLRNKIGSLSLNKPWIIMGTSNNPPITRMTRLS